MCTGGGDGSGSRGKLEKPQLSASLGLCKSVAEEVDVGVGGNR